LDAHEKRLACEIDAHVHAQRQPDACRRSQQHERRERAALRRVTRSCSAMKSRGAKALQPLGVRAMQAWIQT
jgi:hypothetical protein